MVSPNVQAGRIDRPDTLLAFLGSWVAGPTPLRTKGRRSVCPRTVLPNPCWKRLSWQPSFCAPCLGPRLALARRGPLQWARADTQARVTVTQWHPWRQVADGPLCFSQNWMGRMWSRPNWSTSEAATIRPSSGKRLADWRYLPWRRPRGTELSRLTPLRQLLSSALSR